MSPHLSVKSDFIDLIYFSGSRNLRLVESDVRKKFIFEVEISRFRGRESVRGLVRDLLYDGRTGREVAERIFSNAVARAYARDVAVDIVRLTTEETKALIDKKRRECAYGLCVVASDRRTLGFYDNLGELGCDLFYPSSRSLANALIVSPAADADLGGFRDIVFLDTPSDFNLAELEGRQVFVNGDICGYKMFSGLDTRRESLLEIFAALRREAASLNGDTAEELAVACGALGFDSREFVFALNVFSDLGLVAFSEGKLVVYRGVKAELKDSVIYRRIQRLQEE